MCGGVESKGRVRSQAGGLAVPSRPGSDLQGHLIYTNGAIRVNLMLHITTRYCEDSGEWTCMYGVIAKKRTQQRLIFWSNRYAFAVNVSMGWH